jgi:predicted Zn-dependent peptidase
VGTFTKNKTVGKTVNLILKLIREFHQKGATEEELRKAKGYFLGGYPLKLETPLDLAYRVLTSELYGYGKDYIYWEKKFVPSLTLKKINRVARKFFHDRPVVIVCVGPASKIKAQLEKFGPVKVIKPPKF